MALLGGQRAWIATPHGLSTGVHRPGGGAFEGMGKGSQRMLYREPEGLPVPFIRGPVSPLFLAITILHQNQLFPYLSI